MRRVPITTPALRQHTTRQRHNTTAELVEVISSHSGKEAYVKYAKLYVAAMRTAPFTEAEPAEIGVWTLLLVHCADQENGGRIAGGAELSDRALQRSIGITRAELQESPNQLWSITDGDIIITGYSQEDEQKYKARREQGSRGGKAAAANATANATPSAAAPAPPSAEAHAPPTQSHLIGENPNRRDGRREDFAAKREATAGQIADRIMALRPEWSRPPRLDAAEMRELSDNLATFQALDGSDWHLLRRFLAAKVPQGAAYWQPKRRSQLLASPGDVLSHALRWQGKGPRKPAATHRDPGLK